MSGRTTRTRRDSAAPDPGAGADPGAQADPERAARHSRPSVLSDGTILALVKEGRIRVDPWDPRLVQPASIDLRLGDSFRVFHNHRASAIDLRRPPENLTEEVVVPGDESFVIHPGEFCLGRTLEWVELPDDIVARIEGKALAIDTPVPTPDGWTTMGELRAGEWVFDLDGHPTPVRALSETFVGRPCRAVDFSDGTTIVADLDHRWQVWTRYDLQRRCRPTVLTTGEVERTLMSGSAEYTEYNYHVAQGAPVHYPSRRLPVDPYVLGAWLGGASGAQAASAFADAAVVTEMEPADEPSRRASGPLVYRIGGAGHSRGTATDPCARNGSLSSHLSELCVLGDRHIPRDYLEGSVDQRRALLEGIMDADGDVDIHSRCDVTTVSRRLAQDYRELVASLGHQPVVAEKTAASYGRVCGVRYEVQFTPHERVFRLPRKVARQRLAQRLHIGRAITAVRPCASVPVRCIEVGSPDGMFLVSRSFIPTHNSSLGRLGLIVHATAGFCDPGWRGTLTLELNNLTRVPIKLYPGLPIAQLSFMGLDAPALRPYGSPGLGSHYQGQRAATESRYGGAPHASSIG